jgi:hypothetical protein
LPLPLPITFRYCHAAVRHFRQLPLAISFTPPIFSLLSFSTPLIRFSEFFAAFAVSILMPFHFIAKRH